MTNKNLRQLDLFGGSHRLPAFQKGQRIVVVAASDDEDRNVLDRYNGHHGKVKDYRQLKNDIYEVLLDDGRIGYFFEREIKKEQ
jgi:ribosomal protein L21E